MRASCTVSGSEIKADNIQASFQIKAVKLTVVLCRHSVKHFISIALLLHRPSHCFVTVNIFRRALQGAETLIAFSKGTAIWGRGLKSRFSRLDSHQSFIISPPNFSECSQAWMGLVLYFWNTSFSEVMSDRCVADSQVTSLIIQILTLISDFWIVIDKE